MTPEVVASLPPEVIIQVAKSLEAQGMAKMIYRDEPDGSQTPYLKRHYLHRDDEIAVYIHQFFDSDRDEWLHDHPWDSGNVVVAGGYHEELFEPDGSRKMHWRAPGYICERRSAETFHRVILPEGKKGEVWTVFWRWKRTRRWGFMVDNKEWVDHEQYLGYPSHS
jgi:hypothetical protein